MINQAASSVILIRPTGFGYDPETAASNTFQQRITDPEVKRRAAEEFDELLEALRTCGIGFTVLDPFDPQAPNGVFPNNWFSTHADGAVVLYPMRTASRRAERDPDAETKRTKLASPDDLLDAIVAAWSASRVANGVAKRLPENGETNADGLRMEIVF